MDQLDPTKDRIFDRGRRETLGGAMNSLFEGDSHINMFLRGFTLKQQGYQLGLSSSLWVLGHDRVPPQHMA